MQRNAERNAGQFSASGLRNVTAQGTMRLDAPAAARRETTEAADGLAERDAGREDIAGLKHRQMWRRMYRMAVMNATTKPPWYTPAACSVLKENSVADRSSSFGNRTGS